MGSSKVLAGALAACGVLVVLPGSAAAAEVRIHDVQGAGRVSPLLGQRVSGVPGVVTGVRTEGTAPGFWFQDPEPDGDPRTSEGLFVYAPDAPPRVAVGDVVAVSGTVAEYYAVGDGEQPETTPNQSVTELSGANWEVTGTAPVPAAEPITPDSVPDAYAPDGELDALPLDPARFALDYYESREHMNVSVTDARVVGPTDAYGALTVTSKPEQNAGERGTTTYLGYDEPNSGRLKVEPVGLPVPAANVGDELAGRTEGPLDYSRFGGYLLAATALGEHRPVGVEPEVTRAQDPDELAVATYNVENLAGTDEQSKFDRLARGVAVNLAAPDVIALEEVQDDTGATDDGVVAADGTLRRLVDAIAAAGGPRYEWRQIDPVDGADGGQPGGNIRVAFLFDPTRVSFVDRPGGDAVTPVRAVPAEGRAELSASPGRIAPADPAWEASRKPLVGEFSFRGEPVFVVANHFTSKGGDQPLHGRFQPPARESERQRVEQARLVRGLVADLTAIDPGAKVVVTGDLNDFGFSPAVSALTEGGLLSSAADALPPVERYSYVYEGNAQALDHVLTTPGVGRVDYDVVHVNAEFADQTSDHDPQLARLRP
ncbi:endonuclease/exonuclease/phosphatase family protein [Saccharopolyspora gregorii]|uniref:endonuclease/exonuclease/phosphatase family protein n=1 Tax=Saccharopolyspora gregorii TaxID=33914 RepID=UPI0021ABC124|nr:endonuclease/exonuclease/phosphatase family protein [Saccharopolyspora gregorii]